MRAQDSGEVFTGFPGTRIRFASVAASRTVLTADDEWMLATSAFQRRAVMGSEGPVTLEAFRRWNGDAVQPWSFAELGRWTKALQSLAPSFAALRIALPEEVLIVSTNGTESAGAPYTRANAVVLPGSARGTEEADRFVMAHELWHVASRHAPALATRLYAEIGFESIAELAFPAAWADRRIANPDAPTNRHAMRLQVDGRTPWVTPVLVASRTELKPGETFFHVMEPRLLEVEPGSDGGPSRAVVHGKEPVWHSVRGQHDYLRRLGGNTGYVIHPEETIADNIALLTNGIDPRNPGLLARLRAVLEAPR